MSGRDAGRALLWVLIGGVGLRALIAALLPITLDEAYYLEWSKMLDFGYFDHPPLVAVIGASSLLALSNAFVARLGALLVSALALPFFAALCRRAGMSDSRAFTLALVLFSFNLMGIVGGVLLTPDVGLLLFWTVALNEAAAAVEDNPRRWLTAGIATGLGLLAKYMMVLIGPVFLWVLVRRRRDQLLGPWPYLGGLLALLTFSPHLFWNAQNDWVPFQFQFAHGLTAEVEQDEYSNSPIERPIPDEPTGPEVYWLSFFSGPIETARKLPGPEPEDEAAIPWIFIGLAEFVGACLGLWALLLIPLAASGWERLRRRGPPAERLSPNTASLLAASVWTPIVVFGIVASRKHIEANWPACYMVGASVLLARPLASRLRMVTITAALNASVLLILAVHARFPLYGGAADRVQKETRGFAELAERVRDLRPLLFRRHQTGAMLRFHVPEILVAQWPGTTRPSEFVRRREWSPYTQEDLIEAGGFWYLSNSREVARMPGFSPVGLTQLRYCQGTGLVETPAYEEPTYVAPCPDERLRTWYLVEYSLDP